MQSTESQHISKQIGLSTHLAKKRYSFNERHEPNLPADFFFQDTPDGTACFIIFYTQACRYSRCLGCNLPSLMSQFHVDFKAIMQQIDHLFSKSLSKEQKAGISKLIISNNGSTLDQDTFSTTALIYLFSQINIHCPNVKIVTLETRPEYVELVELEVLRRALQERDNSCQLEIAIGVEVFDEVIRNDHFFKGLSNRQIENLVKQLAEYHYLLKCYLMLKPVPNLSSDAAVADIHKAIDYFDHLANRYDLQINLHLNPTYVASGTELERFFYEGSYQPPTLKEVLRAVLPVKNKRLSVYIALNDEGLAVKDGSYLNEINEETFNQLNRFNATQDIEILEKLLLTCG